MRRSLRASAALLMLAVITGPAPANASGLGTPIVGSTWSSVTTADGGAMHYNPANIARIPGLRLELSAGLIWANISYQREYRGAYQFEDSFEFKLPLQPKHIDPNKSGLAEEVGATVLLPLGSAFLTYSPMKNLTVGVSVYAPFGAALDPDDNGAQKYAVQEALIMGLYITPTVAYRITDWFSIGVGVNVILGTVNLRQVVDLAGTSLLSEALAEPPLNQPNDFGEEAPTAMRELSALSRPATLKTTSLGVSFNVGMTFTPGDWVIGVSYQHGASLVFSGDAWLDMNHDFFTTDLAFKGLEYPSLVVGEAFIELPFPAAVRLGLAWSDKTHEVSVQASYVFWSVVDALRVTLESDDLAQPSLGISSVTKLALPRNYMNTLELELMYGIQLDEDIRFGFMLGYHSPFSPDETMDLSSIDGHRLMGRVMADLKVNDFLTINAYVGFQHVLSRTVTSSRHDLGNGTYGLTMVHFGGQLAFAWPQM